MLSILRIGQTLDQFHIDQNNIYLIGTNAAGGGIIFDLDISRIISHLKI